MPLYSPLKPILWIKINEYHLTALTALSLFNFVMYVQKAKSKLKTISLVFILIVFLNQAL